MTEQKANDILEDCRSRIGSAREDYALLRHAATFFNGPGDTKLKLNEMASEAYSRYYDVVNEVVDAAKFLGKLEATRAIAADIADCPCNLIRKRLDHLTRVDPV